MSDDFMSDEARKEAARKRLQARQAKRGEAQPSSRVHMPQGHRPAGSQMPRQSQRPQAHRSGTNRKPAQAPQRSQQAANALEHPQVQLALKEELAAGITFAKARERAVGRVFGEKVSQILQQPNNILAVEYLAQLRGLSPERRPQAVPLERVGNAHDGAPVQGFASASYLRGLLLAGEWEQAAEYLPDFSLHLYRQAAKEGKLARMENGERAVLSALRRMSREELAALPDISEGIENRLYAAVQKACSLEELYEQIKTKRYPLSRVRRLVLAAFLQIPAQAHQTPPPYLRMLGMNERGREILSRMKRTASLPVSVSLSRLAQSSSEAAALAALEAACADQYGLFTERIFPCGLDYSEPVVKG